MNIWKTKFTTERRVNYCGVIKSSNKTGDFFAVFPTLFTISVDKISVGHMVKINVNKSKLKTELSVIVLAISLCFSPIKRWVWLH